MSPNRRTALYEIHQRLGARFVSFAGWDMPVSYAGIAAEHRAVRTGVGLFDVSHMGEFLVHGPTARELIDHLTINDVSRLREGQAQYSALSTDSGTLLDDIVVYRTGSESYMLVVNASNVAKDWDWIESHNRFGAALENASDRTALVAIQGPRALDVVEDVVEQAAGGDAAGIGYYHSAASEIAGVKGLLSRTGYTGEDGFDFYFPSESSAPVWQSLMEAGARHGLVPVGLGARNTLRLEAGMLLYGNDIDETTTALEAGLDRFCKLDKPEFVGKDALVAQRRAGVRRRLVGFRMLGRSIARDGYEVSIDGRHAGHVTSGGPSITLGRNIGLAYLPVEHGTVGTLFQIRVRQRFGDAEVVPTPFYKRRSSI